MNTLTTSLVWIAIAASMLIGPGAARTSAGAGPDVVIVSGTLNGELLASALFHIGDFWMRVQADTLFNRWLSDGIDKKVVITLVGDPARFADEKNVRILSGTLIHETAAKPTPTSVNVVGKLPDGNSPLVHVLFLKDELTGSLGAVTFETADIDTGMKFDAFDGTHVNIVIKIG